MACLKKIWKTSSVENFNEVDFVVRDNNKKMSLKDIMKLQEYTKIQHHKRKEYNESNPLKQVITFYRWRELGKPNPEEYRAYLLKWKNRVKEQITIRDDDTKISMLNNEDMKEKEYESTHQCRKVFSFGRWRDLGKPTLDDGLAILENEVVKLDKIIKEKEEI